MKIPLVSKSKILGLLDLLKKLLVKYKIAMIFLFVFSVLADMVFLESVNSYVFFLLAVMWFLCELVYTRKHDWYLTLSLILLSLIVPLRFIGLETITEKISIWAFFYLVVTFVKKLQKGEHEITAS